MHTSRIKYTHTHANMAVTIPAFHLNIACPVVEWDITTDLLVNRKITNNLLNIGNGERASSVDLRPV